jgi:hypothetical protein
VRRKTWFELHDHPLYPSFLRDLMTDGLEAMWNSLDTYRAIVPGLRRALGEAGTNRFIDLCSGGGGPWIALSRHLAASAASDAGSPQPTVLLTDKYPNRGAFERLRARIGETIDLYPESVDAMNIPSDLAGFRTIFSAFHHFDPKEARAILEDAFRQRQGIAIFEPAKRDLRTIFVVSFVPLLTFLLTPGIRPFRWSRLFWTYVLPVVPFTLWFDGVMSCLRTYSQDDLWELVEGFSAEDYRWEVGEDRGGLVNVTRLVGCPVLTTKLDIVSLQMETPA